MVQLPLAVRVWCEMVILIGGKHGFELLVLFEQSLDFFLHLEVVSRSVSTMLSCFMNAGWWWWWWWAAKDPLTWASSCRLGRATSIPS